LRWPFKPKRKLIAACALAALSIGGTLSATAQTDGPGVIEIYEHYDHYTLDAPPPDKKPIILKVPEEFRYGGSKGATRNWGLNLLTFYPSFTSPRAPENTKFASHCIGICNGQVLIAIENRTHSINSPIHYNSPNMGDYIAHANIKWNRNFPSSQKLTELGPQDGFTSGFEIADIIPGQLSTTRKYFFRLSPDKVHYDLTAECNTNQYGTHCTLHFSLSCNPAIYVSVNGIGGSYLQYASDIQEKTDKFVSSMVISPACKIASSRCVVG
jgi:hypothetical protein